MTSMFARSLFWNKTVKVQNSLHWHLYLSAEKMGERASAEIPATFSSSSILHACALYSGLRGRSRRSGRREAPPRRSLHSSMVLLTSLLEQKQRPEGSNTPSDLHDPHFCSHGNQSQPPGHTFCRDPKLKAHSRPGQLVIMMFRWSWSFLPVCVYSLSLFLAAAL